MTMITLKVKTLVVDTNVQDFPSPERLQYQNHV